jgi:hypothetical protein
MQSLFITFVVSSSNAGERSGVNSVYRVYGARRVTAVTNCPFFSGTLGEAQCGRRDTQP